MDSTLREDDLLDPHPDIHSLFCHYNSLYFQDALGACVLTWSSKRMTLCAGVCRYEIGGSCEIHLSEPLLKFRSTADLKNTLLHEMIHAYLWIQNKKKDHNDHGPSFQKLMNEINTSSVIDHQRPHGGYNVTIYHSFDDEVNNYRVHHWECVSCGDVIKRAMNREPSPNDCIVKSRHNDFCGNSSCHWHVHKVSCGGGYKKIAEPPGYKDKRKGSKGNLGCDGANSEVPTHVTRKSARKGPKGVQIKNESDVHKSKTIENFYPITSEGNKNSGSTLPSSDDLQNNSQFDDFHEANSRVSTSPTRKSARKAHNEERIEDKPHILKSVAIRNFYPVTSEANRSLDGTSSSGYDLENNLNIDESTSEEETWNHAVPVRKAKLQDDQTLGKKRKRALARGNEIKKFENYTVIIKWKNWYANEDEEDDTEPLHNKRTERRSKQMLLENPAGVVHRAQPLEDASRASSNSDSVPATLFKNNNHGREHEDGPSTSNGNSMKQSNVLVDDDTLHRADSNDSVYYCQKDQHARQNVNHSAASVGLADVAGINGRDIDVVELSDG